MEENKELIEETLVENETEEITPETEAIPEEDTASEAESVEDIDTEAVVDENEESVSEEAVSEEDVVSEQDTVKSSKGKKCLIQIISAIVLIAIVATLTVFLTPRVKYMYAINLAEKGKAEKAYEILSEIDGSYEKAEKALKRFVVIPAKITTTNTGGMGNSSAEYTRKIKTGKNTMEETLKDGSQSQITKSTYDKNGNVIKEEISQPESGSKYVCTYKYDKDGNRTHYLVESEGTKVYEATYKYDKKGNCTYSSVFEMSYMGETTTETKNENYKVYYVKSK